MVELISSLGALLWVGNWLVVGLLLGDRLTEGSPVGSRVVKLSLGDRLVEGLPVVASLGKLDDVGESEFEGTLLRTIEGKTLGFSVTAFSDGARLGCLLGF